MADEIAPDAGGAPSPRTRLMEEVANQMDAIETDLGENFQIGRVITIVEVVDGEGSLDVRVRSAAYPWVTLGFLEWAKKLVEAQFGGQAPS